MAESSRQCVAGAADGRVDGIEVALDARIKGVRAF